MFKNFLKINLLILFCVNFSFAEIVNKIEIKGNQRLSNESIILFGNISLNKEYDDNDLNIILKELYKTNFFSQIKLNIDNGKLLIEIVENPIVEDVSINGIKNKKMNDALMDSLALKNRKSYIETIHKNDINMLRNLIKQSGYFFAEIKTSKIVNAEQNSIQLIYDIDLGDKAAISEIVFLGDKKIKDRKLRNVITTEEDRFWKFISNNVFLNQERINLDKRLLKNYYKNKGYYNVKIENSFVEFKDNNSFKLVFNIDAGLKFTIKNVNLILPNDFDPRHFTEITNYFAKLENKIYSLEKIEKVLNKIDDIAISKKYEFLDASMEEKIVSSDKLNISIILTETEKYYVEKINISGNVFTIEEVIRNTFIVDEGDPYNELLFNKSVNAIKSKGIFKSVKTNIKPGSKENFKILEVIVEEKPTGEISLGAGVGTSGGSIGFGVKENNFLGKGISLDTNLQISQNTVKGQFIYSKPNFNYSDNTLFTSLSSTTTDNITDFGYKTSNIAASLGTEFEQYEDFYFNPSLNTSIEKLETTSTASKNLKKQEGDYFDVNVAYSLNYDKRNKKYQPDDGFQNIFYQELPIVSNNYEIVHNVVSNHYQSLPSDMVGKFSFYVKSVNSLKDEDVRISKRLYIPSARLRGFEKGKVGPVDNSDYIGGNYVSTFNVSSTLPNALPSFQNLDFSLFFDAANVWGVDYDSSIDRGGKIRSSTGVALNVFTPIGPLNFSLAHPISKAASDRTETFRFNLGTTF